MKGWILDCYPDYERGCIIVWLKTEHGIERLVDRHFRPSFYVAGPDDRLAEAERGLRMIDVKDVFREKRTTLMDREPRDVLRVTPDDYASFQQVARMVDTWGKYRDYQLYDVDLRFDQRYFTQHGIFPMGYLDVDTKYRMLDSPDLIDYPIPELSTLQLTVDAAAPQGIPTVEDPIQKVTLDDVVLAGPEDHILDELKKIVRERDPDILYTDGGDAFYLEYLAKRAEANGVDGFDLGRDAGFRRSKGKSYFTYGRIMYKPPAHKLRGRVHVDAESSFMYDESGVHGLIDLSRMCLIPMQDLSRLSPGSAISAMQVNQAIRDGHLVLWKKNLPEGFKTAGALLVSDRGGFIFEPVVGIHDRVVEVDFTSLYPSIMVRHNISPETLLCPCCPDSKHLVPEIGYRICEKQVGLLAIVLEPIIHRRLEFKRRMKEDPAHREMWDQRSKILKWVLVTCFGYTGYKNARFGRIECHESITAFGRDILLRTSETAERHGFRVLHGIVDSLWLEGKGDPIKFCREVSDDIRIPLQLEGIYKWIVFLPSISTGIGALNRYYGLFESGELKLRGIFLRKRDTITYARELQTALLEVFTKANDSAQFRERIPEALIVLDSYLRALKNGTVPLEKLIISHRISKEVEEYSQFNDSYAALRQMKERGFDVPPGKSVEYLITDGESKSVWERVKAASFIDGNERYDTKEYGELLFRATADLLFPFGWSFEALQERSAAQRT
jgi:DNA polymerase elongation subunit (family B)